MNRAGDARSTLGAGAFNAAFACALLTSAALTLPSGTAMAPAFAAASPECPESVGSYALDRDPYATIEAPDVGWLECSYDISDGDVTVTAGWKTAQGIGGGYCGLPQDPGDLISDDRDASVSVAHSGGTEYPSPEFQAAARALLAEIEAVAQSCGGDSSGSGAGQGSTTTTTTPGTTTSGTTAPPAPGGKRLCAEALSLLEGFDAADLQAAGVDATHTSLRVDGRSLAADFEDAIRSYERANPGKRAYVTWGVPFGGELGTMSWLFSYGGALGGPAARAYVTGTESRLLARIVQRAGRFGSPGQPARLSPGEVFALSLELNDGNAAQALLAAHNLLRGAFRNDAVAAPGITYDNGAYLGRYLMELRGNDDNGGPWYHMFGTAYAEVVARGDWGPWLAAGGAAAAFSAGLLTGPAALALGGLALAWQNESDTSGTTGASRFFNGFEQIVREVHSGNKPDPEKFCFNVWGAQIGGKVYEALPLRGTQRLSDPFSGFAPPSEPTPFLDPAETLSGARFVNGVGSPYAVRWRNGTMEMLLDQRPDPADTRLHGGVPTWLFPVLEGDSWGVVWMSPSNSGESIELEAIVDAAPLVFVRTDTQTGETAFYETTAAHAGDRFKISVDPGALAPPMSAADGSIILARIVSIDLGDGDASAAGRTTGAGDRNAGTSPPEHWSDPGFGLPAVLVVFGVVAAAVALEIRRSNERKHHNPPRIP